MQNLPANADGAQSFRCHFARWIDATVTASSQRRCAIALAVYEAVANAAEHAYTPATTGADIALITVSAYYQPGPGTLHVRVIDRGSWKQPQPSPTRGLGLPLIDALSSTVHVTTGPVGTTVTMHWSSLY